MTLDENYEKCTACGKFSVHLFIAYGDIQFFGDIMDMDAEASKYADDLVVLRLGEDIGLTAHICAECGHVVDIYVRKEE